MKSPYDIILRPVLTEKSYAEMADKKYTFEVAVTAGTVSYTHLGFRMRTLLQDRRPG